MTRRYHSNNTSTTLAAAITNSQATLTVASASGFPTITTNETFRLTLTQNGRLEIVIVTSVSGTTFTITRGAESTTGQAFNTGAIVELRQTANSIDRKADMVSTVGDVLDFGDATSLEIPNNATATLSSPGQIALDTSVTDIADGLLCYRAGSIDYGVVAIPKSGFTSPTDTYVVTYDAATDKFKLAAGGGGGGGSPGGSNTQVQYNSSGSFAGHSGFTYDGAGTATTTTGLVTPTLTATAAAVLGGNASASGYLKLLEQSTNGSNFIKIQAPAALSADTTYTWPSADGSNTYVLQTNGSGVLSWVAPSGGGGSGDVVGPSSATDNAIARFDTTTGKLIQNSGASITDDANLLALNCNSTSATTATAGSTTTLTVASARIQFFTGSSGQTCRLPVVTTLPQLGFAFEIVNDSTGAVTIQSSGGNTIISMAANTRAIVRCIALTGTTASSWSYDYTTKGTIADADYGDITVASGVWSIDAPSNVTLASGDKILLKTASSSFATMAGVAASNIASQAISVGTLTTGTWNATAIAYNYGGTGLTAIAQGDIIYGSSTSAYSRLTKDTNATRYLSNQGTSNNPSWNQVNLSNGVTSTLPVANGGTGITTASPAFKARCTTTQTFGASGYTKVQCNTEDFDTASAYDNATNYRFTPLVAGRYLFVATCAVTSMPDTKQVGVAFYKNGVVNQFNGIYNGATAGLQVNGSAIIDLNGSTDYVELYIWNGDTATKTNETTSSEFNSMFSGVYLG